MTVAELTLRVERLERDVSVLKQQLAQTSDPRPCVEQVRGLWAGDPIMKEITELGRKYRESLRPGAKKKPRRAKRRK